MDVWERTPITIIRCKAGKACNVLVLYSAPMHQINVACQLSCKMALKLNNKEGISEILEDSALHLYFPDSSKRCWALAKSCRPVPALLLIKIFVNHRQAHGLLPPCAARARCRCLAEARMTAKRHSPAPAEVALVYVCRQHHQ